MTGAAVIDGKALAQSLQAHMADRIAELKQRFGRAPGLAVLMVGDNPASAAYVGNKERSCARVGMVSWGKHFPESVSQADLLAVIDSLNHDPLVDGILVQLPLPDRFDAVALIRAIDPTKDVDGLHPLNLGKLLRGEPGLRSCTPAGVMELLRALPLELRGKHAVVVGRSILVGKPLSLMLLDAHATVTIAHSRTPDLGAVTRQADILVSAVGQPELITSPMVKPGAVVIDVGINRVERTGKSILVGDVDFASVAAVAAHITPVPGGVGPMTVTLLLQNTLRSFCERYGAPL